MAIVINGSGTVTGLAVGGLPDGTVDDGTLASGIASSKLTGSLPAISGASLTGLTSSQMPAGHILQTVTASTTSISTTTSTSYVATAVAVTITPSSTASKILILHQGMLNKQSALQWQFVTLYRGSTNLGAGGSLDAMSGMYNSGGSDTHVPFPVNHLDSPNTTSAVTYKVYQKVNGGQARYNADGWKLYITAIEIKG